MIKTCKNCPYVSRQSKIQRTYNTKSRLIRIDEITRLHCRKYDKATDEMNRCSIVDLPEQEKAPTEIVTYFED